MAPIRVGLVGLSTAEGFVPGAWATTAFLPTFLNSPDYEIVALCNSTPESARRSIEKHNLPASTKAYGSVEDLANDADVDLVVVSVRVAKHHELTKPALLKKKQVFVEWPLGASLQEAEQLTQQAATSGLKTAVGLQARADRLVVKLKQIIDSGKIGKVIASSVVANASALPNDFWFEGAEYYLDLNSGGNLFHIFFGHFLDSFTHVLGDFAFLQSALKAETTQLPVVSLQDGKVINPAQPKNVPDHILVQGGLENGAMASIAYRWTKSSVDGVGLRWIITGSEGEIEVTTDQSQWQTNSPNRKLKVKIGKDGETEEVDFGDVDLGFAANVPAGGLNTALALDAFAKGDTSRYADFASALKTHRLLDEIIQKSGYKY